ncbi:non-hydrolyzing UDP-N-acetylglucosamine 2-epimerase [Actinoplanes sp. NPDC026623]|uniref:non-hydrolyzing UDP-N-acetylglucosamine 2-epimerase n=1 Tax=Actinoplanes sp. NPDC026623 TaxID=3155610 RepID=UPI0033F302FD
MALPEVHLICGTRTQAVRLAPVAAAMREAGVVAPVLVAGGRYPAMAGQALTAFGLFPDVTLRVERGAGSRSELRTEMIRRLDELWTERPPAAALVQGDTTTSLAGALAACWRRIPVVHLEAGQRGDHLGSSFPEEADRRLIAQVATLHLTATPLAAMNLLDEDVATGDVLITGNTVVDAAHTVAGRRLPFVNLEVAAVRAAAADRRLLVVAVRRRESWGAALDRVLAAVRRLVERYADLDVIIATDPNPAVRAQAHAGIGDVDRVMITGSLPHQDLTRLLSEAYLVLTDTADLQQEARSFGVPALVLLEDADPAGSAAGGARLVGSDDATIVEEAAALLDSRVRRDAMTAGGNPYGDGLAARRVAQATAALLGLADHPDPMPALGSYAGAYGASF